MSLSDLSRALNNVCEPLVPHPKLSTVFVLAIRQGHPYVQCCKESYPK